MRYVTLKTEEIAALEAGIKSTNDTMGQSENLWRIKIRHKYLIV